MSNEQRSAGEVRLFTRTLIKFVVFVVVCSAGMVLIIGTLRGETGGKADEYRADFADVSGLVSGDPVRVSGVTVGEVRSVELVDAAHIRVTFTANRDQQITERTFAQVRYANLLGQRFLALTQSGAATSVLRPGSTIPMKRTAPAVSLTTLLNGFRPLFQSLDASQVDQLMGSLVEVLQGQTNRIDDIVAQTAQLTTNLADRSGLIADVVDSLSTLVTTVAEHDQQFAVAVGNLKELTTYLAADSKNIGRSITSLAEMSAAMDGLVTGVRGAGIGPLVRDVNQIGGTLLASSGRLQQTIASFPKTFAALNRITQSGTWANGYPCAASVRTIGDPRVSVGDVAASIAAFFGLSKGNILSTLLAVTHLGSAGVSIPVEVPQGAIGRDTSTEVCR
jgi:phospholipid/cholesterol/gamma-HCH transport system substrate-binding protein